MSSGQSIDTTLIHAKFSLELRLMPTDLQLSASVDELISYQFREPKGLDLEYNSVASYDDLKRLSSFFNAEEEKNPESNDVSAEGDAEIDPALRDAKVAELQTLTLLTKDECLFYLESMNWDVKSATRSYYQLLR